MKNLLISFSFLLYFSFLPNLSYAFQVAGGEITYSCTGNPGEYSVELRLYTFVDEPSSMSETINYSSANCGSDESLELSLISTTGISQDCPALINVEERLFRGILDLTLSYIEIIDNVEYVREASNCGPDWLLSYSTCCRSNTITSGAANEDFYISAALDNTLQPCNSSPIFSSPGLIFTCETDPISYSQGASEADGDLLVYSLTNCQQNNAQSVSYNAGFNGSQAFSTTSGITIDPETGEINFTPSPGVIQVAPICVLVEEYRNGVKIGETVREITFVSNQEIIEVSVPGMGQWGIILMILLLLVVGGTVLNSIQTTD